MKGKCGLGKWSLGRSHCPWIINYFISFCKNWVIISNGTLSVFITQCLSDIKLTVSWRAAPLLKSAEAALAGKTDTLTPSLQKSMAAQEQLFHSFWRARTFNHNSKSVASVKMMGKLKMSTLFCDFRSNRDLSQWGKRVEMKAEHQFCLCFSGSISVLAIFKYRLFQL